MKYLKSFCLLFIFVFVLSFLTPISSVKACTWDGTCLTDCPAPPAMTLAARPWCGTLPEYGDIYIDSNISSSWTATGPITFSGSGVFQAYYSAPVGTYTVTWADVPGYTVSAPYSQTLVNQGDAIGFNGVYTVVAAPSVNINFSFLDRLNLLLANI